MTLTVLVLTRAVLVLRAKPPGGNAGLKAFKSADGLFKTLNHRLARGIEFGRSSDRLPGDHPIAWRETTKTTLGNPRYLTRTLLGLLTPILITVVLLVANNATGDAMPILAFVAVLYWLLVSLMLAVRSAGLFTAERSGQTLDVLLSTPLPTKQIVRQKLRGVWRLAFTAAIPLLTIAALSAYFQDGGMGYRFNRSIGPPWLYLSVTAGCVAVFLPLVMFVGVLCGMALKTPARAAIGSVAAVFALCAAPPLGFAFLSEFGRIPEQEVAWVMMSSPAVLIGMNEARELDEFLTREWRSNTGVSASGDRPWGIDTPTLCLLAAGLALLLHAGLAFAVRLVCYRYAAPLLGRGDRPPWAGERHTLPATGGVG